MSGNTLSTGCSSLDELLGGGFERGTVSQLYGPPAAGKTNVALSTAVETARAGGTTIYIDTEGVSIDRFEQLLRARHSAAVQYAQSTADLEEPAPAEPVDAAEESAPTEPVDAAEESAPTEPVDAAEESVPAEPVDAVEESVPTDNPSKVEQVPSVEDLASRIIIQDVHDFGQQAEAVRDVESFAEQADLIILDSATGFYRLERDDNDDGEALRDVTRQVTHLLSVARKYNVAVVLTNQVFADPDSDRVRALGGNTLEHWTGVILRLERFRAGNRRATLEKHRSKPAGKSMDFQIADTGLKSSDQTVR